jgi:hypothetical protein
MQEFFDLAHGSQNTNGSEGNQPTCRDLTYALGKGR